MAKVHDSGSNNYVRHNVQAVFRSRPRFVPDKWVFGEDTIDLKPEDADLDAWPEGACFVDATFTYNFAGDGPNNWDELKTGDELLRACTEDNDDLVYANLENEVD